MKAEILGAGSRGHVGGGGRRTRAELQRAASRRGGGGERAPGSLGARLGLGSGVPGERTSVPRRRDGERASNGEEHLCPIPPSPAPPITSTVTSALPRSPLGRSREFLCPRPGGCQLKALAALPKNHSNRRNNNARRRALCASRAAGRVRGFGAPLNPENRTFLSASSVWRGRPHHPVLGSSPRPATHAHPPPPTVFLSKLFNPPFPTAPPTARTKRCLFPAPEPQSGLGAQRVLGLFCSPGP